VSEAAVILPDGERRSIGRGLLVFVGFQRGDPEHVPEKIARKVAHLRVFEDADGKMNLSVRDVGGEVLLIPNFTLAGDTRKGNRPSFGGAESPDVARRMFLNLYGLLAEMVKTKRGEFGSHMRIFSINDGPVNLILKITG